VLKLTKQKTIDKNLVKMVELRKNLQVFQQQNFLPKMLQLKIDIDKLKNYYL
jgi:hypothetical protein